MTPAAPRSCASCGVNHCDMHRRHGRGADPVSLRTAWLLDDVWPEYASYVAASARQDDQIIAPGFIARAWPARYGWSGVVQHVGSIATAVRHIAMRRVRHAPGHVRQAAYLDHDRRLALRLAQTVDYRARHLVVAQSWLPWLAQAGVLGGRSYDVLMSRYPFADIHRLLDHAAQVLGEKADVTITDFRAPGDLVRLETEALARARRIITPHHGIAALFPLQSVKLAWHLPDSSNQRKTGRRLAFIGPSLSRNRPDLARTYAQEHGEPLILLGSGRSDSAIWQGLSVEYRTFGPDWLDDIGTIIHPATMTNQPRRLLEALAHDVTVIATAECGLDAMQFRAL